MTAVSIAKKSRDFLNDLQPKQYKQVANRVLALVSDPFPSDYRHLSGHPGCYRLDSGEFRIIYSFDPKESLIEVRIIGKRNDDEVYREFDRVKK